MTGADANGLDHATHKVYSWRGSKAACVAHLVLVAGQAPKPPQAVHGHLIQVRWQHVTIGDPKHCPSNIKKALQCGEFDGL